jgi:hypothetical protein
MARRLTGRTNEYGELAMRRARENPVIQSATPRYSPWYESDPERYEAEDRSMRDLGFAGRLYQDGRLVYGGIVKDAMVAVFLDQMNPVKPPSLFVLSDNLPLPRDAFNPDGSVDLFYGDHHWNPNEMTASILVTWLEELLAECESEEEGSAT